MHRQRREGARIHERYAGSVVELERRPGVARQGVCDRADVPVASHAKVHVDRAAVAELEQLVLSAAQHARDDCASERAQAVRGQLSPEGWMQESHVREFLSNGGTANDASGPLDFRKLRHDPNSLA